MKFDMGEDFWITSDSRQWMLKKYKGVDKNGEAMFAMIGYYVEFENVIKALYRYRLRTDEAQDFQEAKRRANEILEDIANRLEPDYKLTLQAALEPHVDEIS